MAGGEQRTKVEERGCKEQSDHLSLSITLLCSRYFPEHLHLKALTSCTLAATFLLHSFFSCFYCAVHFSPFLHSFYPPSFSAILFSTPSSILTVKQQIPFAVFHIAGQVLSNPSQACEVGSYSVSP